jgi:mono/diheme cytochrome c family protein
MKNLKKISKLNSVLMLLITGVIVVSLSAFQSSKWKAPDAAKGVKNPTTADANNIAEGKKVYTSDCQKCHGKKGMGDGPNASELDNPLEPLNSAGIKAETDGELFWKMSEGKKPMPSAKKTLSETQRWQLVDYIRTFAAK